MRSHLRVARDARRQILFVGVSSLCFIALPHANCKGIDQPLKSHIKNFVSRILGIRCTYNAKAAFNECFRKSGLDIVEVQHWGIGGWILITQF